MATKNSERKQRHRSAAEWRRLVSAWKASGKTRRDWCKEQGLSTESLRRWTKRLRGTESKVSLVEIDHRGNHGASDRPDSHPNHSRRRRRALGQLTRRESFGPCCA